MRYLILLVLFLTAISCSSPPVVIQSNRMFISCMDSCIGSVSDSYSSRIDHEQGREAYIESKCYYETNSMGRCEASAEQDYSFMFIYKLKEHCISYCSKQDPVYPGVNLKLNLK